jgi:hypothetical protein
MKKWLLMTAALMALASTVAFADGMNLSWGTGCRTATNNLSAATNDFTPIMPCDDGSSPWVTKRIVMSFKNTSTLLQFAGTTVVLDVQVAGSPLADFWNFGPGGCADGMIAGATVVANGVNCTNPYTLTPTDPAGQTDLSNIQVDALNSRVSYSADHVRNTLGVDLPPPVSTGGYTANNLALPYGYSDGSLGGPCAGCDVPACFGLVSVVYFSLTESRVINAPDLRNNITWAGGVGANCPGGTLTRSATWGQVKALYR